MTVHKRHADPRALTPEMIARRAAAVLGADMDPSFPARVESVLQCSPSTRPDALCSQDALASFVVAAADLGAEIAASLRQGCGTVDTGLLADHLARAMGIDPGISADHERIVEAVADSIENGSDED
ncbi:MAG: hypothetical protein P9C36_05930 [Defluviicoccus sp.]|nr:hypothetical protein [Defluviicoccus sp.]MDG4592149.1 hypothetical protein [Defluviicoccus sp.]MDS4010549.1 hypothetical protein [Defluviicoccus sp.]MDS4072514.1 hypothetical protein [Defluviicoccus sp.]